MRLFDASRVKSTLPVKSWVKDLMPRIIALLVLIALCLPVGAATPVQIDIASDRVTNCVRPCDEKIAVFFIHGLTGDRTTWQNAGTHKFFQDLIREDPALDSADIYTISYPSGEFTGPALVQILSSLETKLDNIIRSYRRVVIVAHSLGGNISLAYMGHLKNRWGHLALGRVRLLITLATPFEGAAMAQSAAWVSGNEQLRVLTPIQVNDFLQLLDHDKVDFTQKHLEQGCPVLQIYTAYEKLPLPGVGIVVPQDSATDHSPLAIGFDRTHISISKPADKNDEVYRWVAGLLKSCIDAGAACPPLPISPQCTGDLH